MTERGQFFRRKGEKEEFRGGEERVKTEEKEDRRKATQWLII